ncbi:MAG TPA: hypothetical protein VFE50_22060 [Cyclobacteriaceae bacterium]|nr:hypothetical protein [Cyclobacteriaceae bacterium]
MMKLCNFFLLVVIAFFASCNKDGDPKISPCLMLSQASSASGLTQTFNYDGETITSMTTSNGSSSTVTAFVYESGKLTKFTVDGAPYVVFTYTGDNITKQEVLSSNGVTSGITEYEYSGGNLVKIQQYSSVNGSWQKSDYTTLEYYDNSDNILRVKRYAGSSSPISVLDYTMYGANNAPYSAFPPAVLKYAKLGGTPIGLNILKITSANGTETNYTYEFNEKGYPTKQTATGSSGATVVQTYSYKCN